MSDSTLNLANTNVDAVLGGNSAELQAIYQRLKRLNDEIETLKEDSKTVMAEAKSKGFDTKLIRKVMALAKKRASEVRELEEMTPVYLAVYRKACGNDA